MSVVLGLTGANAAGKGEVCQLLEGEGFRVHSLSDIVREEAARQGLTPEREHLIRTGNRLREQGGAGVLAERILERLGDRDVVDSIRNPTEVEVLRTRPDFLLVGVWAPRQLRFERSMKRARPGDPLDLKTFLRREEQENSEDPAAQRLLATFRLVDRVVHNEGELGQLAAEVRSLVEELEAKPR